MRPLPNATASIRNAMTSVLGLALAASLSHCGGGGSDSSYTTPNSGAPYHLTYSTNPAVYTKDVAITPNVPSLVSGTATVYGTAGTLPTGLTIDPKTGIISGTPTVVWPTSNYVMNVSNGSGATTCVLTITVN